MALYLIERTIENRTAATHLVELAGEEVKTIPVKRGDEAHLQYELACAVHASYRQNVWQYARCSTGRRHRGCMWISRLSAVPSQP